MRVEGRQPLERHENAKHEPGIGRKRLGDRLHREGVPLTARKGKVHLLAHCRAGPEVLSGDGLRDDHTLGIVRIGPAGGHRDRHQTQIVGLAKGHPLLRRLVTREDGGAGAGHSERTLYAREPLRNGRPQGGGRGAPHLLDSFHLTHLFDDEDPVPVRQVGVQVQVPVQKEIHRHAAGQRDGKTKHVDGRGQPLAQDVAQTQSPVIPKHQARLPCPEPESTGDQQQHISTELPPRRGGTDVLGNLGEVLDEIADRGFTLLLEQPSEKTGRPAGRFKRHHSAPPAGSRPVTPCHMACSTVRTRMSCRRPRSVSR